MQHGAKNSFMSSHTKEYDVPLNKGTHFPCYSSKANASVFGAMVENPTFPEGEWLNPQTEKDNTMIDKHFGANLKNSS